MKARLPLVAFEGATTGGTGSASGDGATVFDPVELTVELTIGAGLVSFNPTVLLFRFGVTVELIVTSPSIGL